MLTLAFNYYDNPTMLAVHIEAWRRYPEGFRFLIVDDGSPNGPALPVVEKHGRDLPIAVYRVMENIPWNWDGARNLAMTVAKTEWVWLLDMDRLVEPEQAAKALALTKRPGEWYRPNQRLTDGRFLNRPHPNCYIVSRTDFWKTGGHDLDFMGFYDKDKQFRLRLEAVATPVYVPGIYMTGYQRSDVDDCSTRMGRKGSPYHFANAPDHLKAKAAGPFYVAERPLRFEWERQL